MAAGSRPRKVSLELPYDDWRLLQQLAELFHTTGEDMATVWVVERIRELDAELRAGSE